MSKECNRSVMVQNVPEHISNKEHIVARVCDGQLWYWGSLMEAKNAEKACGKIDGVVLYGDAE